MRILIIFLLAASANAGSEIAATVKTESGLVSGGGTGVRVYRGIPYAAAPVGPLRWRPPAPPPHWQGVRRSIEFGPACPQAVSLTLAGANLPKQSEDCLTLNIWTPALHANQRLPVLVSIHGGGFVAGAASLDVYDGEGFARQGLVFVSVNYRLGVFGFLAHPALANESPHHASGNYGLMDQIAALRWIQRNIAAFGGDSRRVTIFGESAGGSSVCYLLVSPLAKGLFHGAISQSAQGIYLPMKTAVGEDLGVDIAALRAIGAQELLKKVSQSGSAAAGVQFQPVVDGWVLPDDPAALFDAGKMNGVPVIAGTNTDDAVAMLLLTGASIRTIAAYRDYLTSRFGEAAGRALELYPANSDVESRRMLRQLITDLNFRFGARSVLFAMARRNRAYWYQFTRFDPVSRKLGTSGPMHGAEMGYVFGDLKKSLFTGTPFLPGRPEGFDDTDRALAKAMNGAWVQFVKTGDPNGPDLPNWPLVRASDPQFLEYGDTIQAGKATREPQMRFLTEYFQRLRQSPK